MARTQGRASSGMGSPRVAKSKVSRSTAERRAKSRTANQAKQAGNGRLEPDRGQLATFINALFKYAGTRGYASIRAFYENEHNKSFRISSALLNGGLSNIVDVAVATARRAANADKRIVFSPPIAIFNSRNGWQAQEEDLLLGLALSVECDQHPQEARKKLEQLLGPATVVVESGGEWVNPETGEIEAKLHLHWRLRTPADKTTLADLKTARNIAMLLVGGDPTNVPIVHPIRWPGSWHRKGEPKLCTTIAVTDREIDLAAALEVLRKEAPAATDSARDPFEFRDAPGAVAENWDEDVEGVVSGDDYHGALTRIAAKLAGAGTSEFGIIKMSRALMKASQGAHDGRWKSRYKDIERGVASAVEKYEAKPNPSAIEIKTATQSDPVDLWEKREAPALPKGLLPKVIEEFAFAQANLMGADPAGFAMGALTVCAAALPDHIQLQVKKHDRGWKELARIWTGLVGPPSTMKSPILRRVAQPIACINSKMSRDYREAVEQYEALSGEDKKAALKPAHTRIMIEDTTPEAAQSILRDSPDGVLLMRDELSGWFGSIDKYSSTRGGGMDRGFWLQAYNGAPYTWDRVARGSGDIPNLSISVLGGIQVEPLRKLVADGVDDGLIQRLCMIMLRPAETGKDEPSPQAGDRYDELVEQLHARSTHREGAYEFEDDALAVREQLEQTHVELMRAYEKINKKLAAHVGKYNGLFARLCLLWHCIETIDETGWPPPDIGLNTAQRVADFLHEFLLPHARAFYIDTLGLSDEHDRLTAVAGYILSHKLERIGPRDVQRGDRTMRKLDKKDTDSVFAQLEALGWITRGVGQRDEVRCTVNPEVHRVFALKAKEEAERRMKDQALVIERKTTWRHVHGARG